MKQVDLWFWAIIPPPKIREKLVNLQREIAGKYQATFALKTPPHLTLIPPYYSTEAVHSDINHFLAPALGLRQGPLIEIEDFSRFGRKVIYARVKLNSDLTGLKRTLEEILIREARVAKRATPKKFIPHISLARRDLSDQYFGAAWQNFQLRKFSAIFLADSLYLFQHAGQRWEVYQKIKLKQGV